MAENTGKTIVSRMYGHGRGWAFSAKDFHDLGRVDMALVRLYEANTIRRVIRGIYDYPRYSKLLEQDMAPDLFQVAQALARKFGWRIQPDGTAAQNLIGLSTQVTSQYIFHSDGPNRTYQIGNTKLEFKHVALKEAAFRHHETGIIVHALKTLGKDRLDQKSVDAINKWLPAEKRKAVLRDAEGITDWVYAIIQRICQEDPDARIENAGGGCAVG
jgi:hypothetical protein